MPKFNKENSKQKNNCTQESERQEQKELLTTSEAALYLGISKDALYQRAEREVNKDVAVKLYDRLYFKRSVLDLWLEKERQSAKESKMYKFVVTRKSTGESFIIEAKTHSSAKWRQCSADCGGRKGTNAYTARKMSKQEAEGHENA